MYLRMKTITYTNLSSHSVPAAAGYVRRMESVRRALAEADHVLVGAGAGLSAAAGLKYDGEEFRIYFADFIERFGITDLYTSSFYPYPSEEVRWAYWAKHVHMIRYAPPAMPLYRDLREALEGKDYFVITTNVDGQFRKAGFAAERIFEVQGDYGLMQCSAACHPGLYSNESAVRRLLPAIHDCRVPAELVPRCPVCGGTMDIHVRSDASFVQDDDWYAMAGRYEDFVARCANSRMVLLELGVGFNTPTIIRYPFEQMTCRNRQATLVRVNRDYPAALPENEARTLSFGEPAERFMRDLCGKGAAENENSCEP
jgi:NAD-dependent SIR2 family protein deacetylase